MKLRSIFAFAGFLSLISFQLIYWAVYEYRRGKISQTTGIVDKRDWVYICFYFLPIGISLSLAHLLIPHKISTSLTSVPPCFIHKRVSRKFLGFQTAGEYIFAVLLLLLNYFWVALPISYTIELKGELSTFTLFKYITRKLAIPAMWDFALCVVLYARETYIAQCAIANLNSVDHTRQTTMLFHKFLGTLSFVLLTLHSIGQLIVFLIKDGIDGIIWKTQRGYQNFFGVVAWVLMVFMVMTSFYCIRRKYFKLFYWCHQLYMLVVIFGVLHYRSVIYYLIPSLLVLVYDKIRGFALVKWDNPMARVYSLDDQIVRMDVRLASGQDFQAFKAGNWVDVAVPAISSLDFHPLSISYFRKDVLTFHVSVLGSWSSSLLALTKASVEDGGVAEIPVKLRGFHGGELVELFPKKKYVFFAGGVGISALIPKIEEFLARKNVNPEIDLRLVWVVREVSQLLIYAEFIQVIQEHSLSDHEWKPILFCTRTCDIPTRLDSQTFSNLSRRRLPESYQMLHTPIRLACISLAVFIAGCIGYICGRLAQPSEFYKCENFETLESLAHFQCIYWYYWGPLGFTILFSITFGYLVSIAPSLKRSVSISSESANLISYNEFTTDKALADQEILNFLRDNVQFKRPALKALLQDLAKKRDDCRVYVAGPKSFNSQFEDHGELEICFETWEV